MQEEGLCKQYYAVCCGKLPDKNGEFVDYLLKDGKNNVSKVVKEGTAGAKYAKLLYETLKEIEKDKHILLVTGIAPQQNSFKIYHHTMSTLSHWLSVTTMTLQQEIWN